MVWSLAVVALNGGGLSPASACVAAAMLGNVGVWERRTANSCVITILWTTEGTLALGSKWCTYCLIYSILFLAAPLWDTRRWKDDQPPASPVA